VSGGARAATAPLRVALVGNPNTGKSTLFNALTGLRQKVANYPGVTVERIEGRLRLGDRVATVVDLPGTYSLTAQSPDEAIALETLEGTSPHAPPPDVIVAVVDAVHLERNLFLCSQLLELGRPMVVALNQVDLAAAAGLRIDPVELTLALGVPVVATVATRGEGLDLLRHAIARAPELPRPQRPWSLPDDVAAALQPLQRALENLGYAPGVAAFEALRLIGAPDDDPRLTAHPELCPLRTEAQRQLRAAGRNPASVEAELRYAWIDDVVRRAVRREHPGRRWTDRIDAVVLHRVAGPILFLLLMGLLFQAIFAWAEPVMNVVESVVNSLGWAIASLLPLGELRSLWTDGIVAGVGAVLVFVPQIAILFLFLGLLEDSGYMARAAFLLDRLMRGVGLPGRAFVPLLSGYACAVPAVLATRTIEDRRDRLATILVIPFMSCSARLPIYTLLIGTFVPAVSVAGWISLQGLTLLGMYLLGTGTALGVAALFKRTLLRGRPRPLILELPPYRWPNPRTLVVQVGHRVALFLRRAGTVILALSVVLWALATYPRARVPAGTPPGQASEFQLEQSVLGRAGRAIEPLVRPIGFDWKIGVSILSSLAAREVFVSTMGTIYGVGDATETSPALRDKLRAARDPATGRPAYTPLVAFALMVFYVYALMCVSTIAVVARETGGGRIGWRWAAFQFAFMLALAYVAALLVYQGGRALGWG